jgi:predicted ester cyclase
MYLIAFPDAQITIEDQLAEGDTVATRWTGRGAHQGELMGVPPSGKRVEVARVTISRIEGGKIVEEWDNYDALGMMQGIGAIPEH